MIESLESRIAPATFIVTNLDDAGPGSLREAISLANDAQGADIIVFKEGLIGNIAVSSGEMVITDTLRIKGPGADKLSLDMGDNSRAFQVFDGDNAKDSPLFVGGLSFFEGATVEDGGAISSGESLKINGCVFVNNNAGKGGGAVSVQQGFIDSVAISVDIRNSAFLANSNQIFGGGAVSVSVSGSFTLKNSMFAQNRSVMAQGGGALAVTAGDGERILVEKSKFIENTATFGGAANLSGSGFNGGPTEVIVRGSLFLGNTATELGGGALNVGGGSLVFEANTLIGNSAARNGGGLSAVEFSSLTIRASKFIENVSNGVGEQGGGGVFLDIPEGSTAQIVGTEIGENSATVGGGILLGTKPGTLKIVSSKITGNSAIEGGGICVLFEGGGQQQSASLEIVNSRLLRNTAESSGGAILAGGNGDLSIKGSQFVQNDAQFGGAAFLEKTNLAFITSSLFAENIGREQGGAIFTESPLEIRSSKLVGNVAFTGGAISSRQALEIVSSTISANAAIVASAIFRVGNDPLKIIRTKIIKNLGSEGPPVLEV